MLKQQKKSICTAFEPLLIGDQSSQLILCLEKIYISLDLDCPAEALDNYQTLARQSRSWKMKNSLATKKLRYRALSPLHTGRN